MRVLFLLPWQPLLRSLCLGDCSGFFAPKTSHFKSPRAGQGSLDHSRIRSFVAIRPWISCLTSLGRGSTFSLEKDLPFLPLTGCSVAPSVTWVVSLNPHHHPRSCFYLLLLTDDK